MILYTSASGKQVLEQNRCCKQYDFENREEFIDMIVESKYFK